MDAVYDPVGGSVAEGGGASPGSPRSVVAVGFASGAWARIENHKLVVTNTSLVAVFAGRYRRDEPDAIHS